MSENTNQIIQDRFDDLLEGSHNYHEVNIEIIQLIRDYQDTKAGRKALNATFQAYYTQNPDSEYKPIIEEEIRYLNDVRFNDFKSKAIPALVGGLVGCLATAFWASSSQNNEDSIALEKPAITNTQQQEAHNNLEIDYQQNSL